MQLGISTGKNLMLLLLVSLGWAPTVSTVKEEKRSYCSEDAPEQHLQCHVEILLPRGECACKQTPQIRPWIQIQIPGLQDKESF